MSTITQRKKLSKGAWALIILIFVAIIAVAVLAVFGIVDLTFLADLLVGYAAFGTSGWMNAALIIAAPLIAGMILAVVAYRYFVGQKVTMPTGAYVPPGQTISQQQQSGNETVIS